jgi:hypothetical protein
MSTSPRHDDVGPLNVERAEHVGAEFAALENVCGRAIQSTAMLGYLAHYTRNVFNFGVDTLAEPLGEPDRLPATTGRDELRRAGRSLSFALRRLNNELLAARTGAVLRMLLHTTRGAAICDAVTSAESTVGFVLDLTPGSSPEPAGEAADQRSADRVLAELVADLRQLCQPSQTGKTTAYGMTSPVVTREATALQMRSTPFTGLTDESREILTACREAIRPAALHLVARCNDGEIVFMVDCFDDEALRPYFTQLDADARRKFYLGHAREIGLMATALGRTVHTALGGGMVVRMVLDVEQGAIYYNRLRPGDYLIGVTVDPAGVANSDEEMARLTNTVGRLLDK